MPSKRRQQAKALGDLEAAVLQDEAGQDSQEQKKEESHELQEEGGEAPSSVSRAYQPCSDVTVWHCNTSWPLKWAWIVVILVNSTEYIPPPTFLSYMQATGTNKKSSKSQGQLNFIDTARKQQEKWKNRVQGGNFFKKNQVRNKFKQTTFVEDPCWWWW
jgi:hypothetical protein